jgi:S1-C subfamily serine protease
LQKNNDNPVRCGDDVYSILQKPSPSDTVTLTIGRDGQTMTVLLRLGATTE